jgi:hypothetical protein
MSRKYQLGNFKINKYAYIYCFCSAAAHIGPRPPRFEFSTSHTLDTHTRTHTHTHAPDKNPLNEGSDPCKGCYLHNIRQTQDINNHDVCRIRTCDPSNQAGADPRLRSHGHRDQNFVITYGNSLKCTFQLKMKCATISWVPLSIQYLVHV